MKIEKVRVIVVGGSKENIDRLKPNVDCMSNSCEIEEFSEENIERFTVEANDIIKGLLLSRP